MTARELLKVAKAAGSEINEFSARVGAALVVQAMIDALEDEATAKEADAAPPEPWTPGRKWL